VDDVPAPVYGNMYGHNENFLKYIRLSEVETNLRRRAAGDTREDSKHGPDKGKKNHNISSGYHDG
jgi:hypothetical protein